MPGYSYQCQACRKSFTVHLTMSDHDTARVKCPHCGARKVRQLFGSFGVKTSKKS